MDHSYLRTRPRRLTRRPLLHLGSGARGFTLVEVAVVTVLSAVLFLVVVRWVFGFVSAADQSTQLAAVTNDANFVSQSLRTDLQRATSCGPGTSPFVYVGPTKVAFYADVVGPSGSGGPDGVPDLVEWRFQGGAVDRAVVAGTGNCSALLSATPTWTTIADGLAPSSNVVSAYVAGSTLAAAEPGSCAGSAAQQCLFSTIAVNAELDAPDGAPASIDVVAPINLSSSTLSALP